MITLNCVVFSFKIYFSFSFCSDFNLEATAVTTDKMFTPWWTFFECFLIHLLFWLWKNFHIYYFLFLWCDSYREYLTYPCLSRCKCLMHYHKVSMSQNCEPWLSYILAELSNMCLKESCLPDCWKVSQMIYLKILGKGLQLKTREMQPFFWSPVWF